MHIEENFAMQQLFALADEIAALQKGVAYQDLGIGKKREASRPQVFQLEGINVLNRYESDSLYDSRKTPRGSVAHLKLSGVMRSEDSFCQQGVSSLINDIRAAQANSAISAILIEARTGGGEALAGEELHASLLNSNKPVLVFAHLLCSAGAMATASASEIIASNPNATFGSIGTMISIDVAMVDEFKKRFKNIYATKSTNKNKATEGLLKGDMEAMMQSLDRTNENFLNLMSQNRPLRGSAAEKEYTLSGAVFDASEAKKRGLVDSIGGWQYVLKRLNEHINNLNH